MESSREPPSAFSLREQARLGQTSLQVLTFEEAEQQDRAYWHARTPLERLRHQECLREMNYGPEVVNQRLQSSGVEFSQVYPRRVVAEVDGISVNIIPLDDLKRNKKASGRYKDLADLENLP